jgi:1,4-alpha-glucan branching enzyme
MVKNSFGVWEITLPAVNGKPAIQHGSRVKVSFIFLLSYAKLHIIKQYLGNHGNGIS